MNETNKISVGVVNYNSQTTIEECIKSIIAQNLACVAEILILDNGSTDNSLHIIEELLKNVSIEVRVIMWPKRCSLSKKYNILLAECKTDILVLMHSDVRIKNKDALCVYAKVFDDPTVVASTSYINHEIADWRNYPFWQKMEFDRLIGRRHRGLMGKFDAFRVSALNKLNNFDAETFFSAGEDWDLMYRIHKIGKIYKTDNEYVHAHSFDSNYGIKKLFSRHASYSQALGALFRHHHVDYLSRPKTFIFAFFREILVCALFCSLFLDVFMGTYVLVPSVLVLIISYAFFYTPKTLLLTSDWRRVVVPFVNIALLFYSVVWSVHGFILGKQTL